MRSLIAILTFLFCLSSCNVEPPELEVRILEAKFKVSSPVTECPGSWVIHRMETGDKFFCANLPDKLCQAGKIFFAKTLYDIPPGNLTPCLTRFNLREIRVLLLYE